MGNAFRQRPFCYTGLEQPSDSVAVERLYDQNFGSDRKSRTAYQFRLTPRGLPGYGFVTKNSQDQVIAALRFYALSLHWPQVPGNPPKLTCLLLGPLAVEESWRGQGLASQLIAKGLQKAERANYPFCFVIGIPQVYNRFSFVAANFMLFSLPKNQPNPPEERGQQLLVKPLPFAARLEGYRQLIGQEEALLCPLKS